MKLTQLLLITLFTCIATSSHAQYNTARNKQWVFGSGAGVNFTSGTPVAFSSSIATSEGSASVADGSGALLFYTDGVTVWDRTNAVMPSGSAIVSYGTVSSTQGSLIVPVVGSATQYYIFSLEEYLGSAFYSRLSYSIVDMSLRGGLGDVSSTSAVLLQDSLTEKLTAVAGNSCNIWVVVRSVDSPIFYSYNVTSGGIISTPVVSRTGTFFGRDASPAGVMKISPDRRKLVCQSYSVASGFPGGTELFDFDPSSGVVSNPRVLDSTAAEYGAEFSPDSKVLYAQTLDTITQYDITSGIAATIRASAYSTGASATYTHLNLGPDGKIYFIGTTGTELGSIANPNVLGAGCGHTATGAVTLATGSSAIFGMNNIVYETSGSGDTSYLASDTLACLSAGATTVIAADTTGTAYFWSTGTTGPTAFISSVGVYTVNVFNDCHLTINSINVRLRPTDSFFRAMDTIVCADALPITLSAQAGFTSYFWDDGSTGLTRNVATAGTYISISNRICDRFVFDTFRVTAVPISREVVVRDSGLCFPGSYRLPAPLGFTRYTWDNGSGSSSRVITAPGWYVVTSDDNCRTRIDTFKVVNTPIFINLGPDTTVCSNYFINAPIDRANTTYLWQDGSRDTFFSAFSTGVYYVTVEKNGCKASDTINVTFRRLQQNIPDVFVCKEDSIFYYVQCTVPPDGSVMWNDGITAPNRVFRDSGTWWVEVRAGECEILDTVRVNTEQCDCWYMVPSAFTPNVDAKNDKVTPLIQAGCPMSGYQFVIYNRWGQEVFSTATPGTGWDGTYKGQPADMGVYMYQLTFFAGANQRKVNATGDITLIR